MAIQDLTTYTGTHGVQLTANATTITAVNFERRDNEWYYYDYGANYFNALDVDFDLNTGGSTAPGSAFGSYFSVNGFSSFASAGSTDIGVVSSYENAWGPGLRYRLWRGYALTIDDTGNLSKDATYYFTLTRTADSTNVVCYIYSDSGRTTLVDTLSISGVGTVKWQWHEAAVHAYNPSAIEPFYGTIANFDFNLAVDVTQPRYLRTQHMRRGLIGPRVF